MKDELTRLVYRVACKSVKMAMRSYVSTHEHDLLANPNRRAFHKYINKALGRLLDSASNTVPERPQIAKHLAMNFQRIFQHLYHNQCTKLFEYHIIV